MVGWGILVAVSLCSVAADGPPAPPGEFTDPHPLRTTIRGPLLRLLDDASLRDGLKLSASEAKVLDGLLKEADATQTALYRQIAGAIKRGATSLPPGVIESRQKANVGELRRKLGPERLRKLMSIAFACWGPQLLLSPGVGEEFGVAAVQLRRLQAIDEKAAVEFGKLASTTGGPKSEAVDAANGKRNRDMLAALDAGQRERFERMAAEGRRTKLDLVVKGEAEREQAALEPRTKVNLSRDRFRPLHVIQNDDVLDALQLRGSARATVRKWATEKTLEESEISTILPEETESPQDRQKKLDSFDEAVNKQLESKLGSEKAARFWELHLQLRGPAGAFMRPHSIALGVDERQLDIAFAKASQAATDASKKLLPPDLPAERAEAAMREVRKAVENAMTGCLTDRQRAEYRKRCGKPFEPPTLARIARRL